jgi:hypothetical protein
MRGKSFIFYVGKHNEKKTILPAGFLENLEIVELENSEGHFKGVFKKMMLQTVSRRARGREQKFCIRRGRETSVEFVTLVTACFKNTFTKDISFKSEEV